MTSHQRSITSHFLALGIIYHETDALVTTFCFAILSCLVMEKSLVM